jgi:abortive infection bacteriophage resistance protein
MTYTKSWKSYEEQLNQLIDCGMQVADHLLALKYLERKGIF